MTKQVPKITMIRRIKYDKQVPKITMIRRIKYDKTSAKNHNDPENKI